MHYRAFPAVRKDRKQHEEKPNSGNNRSAGSSGIPVCRTAAKVKAADAAYVSGTADVRIIQTEASYSSGAEAAVSFSPKEADMDGMLDRPGAWACYMIEVQNAGRNGRGAFHGGASR